MPNPALLAPSLLSADFSRLREEVGDVERAGADWLHVDVMDGHFVPNLTVGPLVVEAIRPHTKLTLDCHLMVTEPALWVEGFARAGADSITVHVESEGRIEDALRAIRGQGCKAGISLNPATPLARIEPMLDHVDLVLVMSVNPGFAGQKFIESAVGKVAEVAAARRGRPFLIEIDGGVNSMNVGALRRAGADVFVAGSAIFSAKDRAQAMADLRKGMA